MKNGKTKNKMAALRPFFLLQGRGYNANFADLGGGIPGIPPPLRIPVFNG
jgi:hypothetical protein